MQILELWVNNDLGDNRRILIRPQLESVIQNTSRDVIKSVRPSSVF